MKLGDSIFDAKIQFGPKQIPKFDFFFQKFYEVLKSCVGQKSFK